MKSRIALLVIFGSLLVGIAGPVSADTAVPTRADQVTAIQTQYNPLFDAEYARLLAVKGKLILDASLYPRFREALADFLNVRQTIDSNLKDSNSDLASVKAYAEEELGEFASTITGLEAQAAKVKTLSCIKGKVVKKVSGIGPKCPKGFKKK